MPRFRCPQCGLTVSVLPADRLPYCHVAGPRLEAFFDAQARAGSGLDPPPAVVEAGCLRRAWARFQGRVAILKAALGLSRAGGAGTVGALWARVRRDQGPLPEILCRLSRAHQRSLLGDYQCLRLPALTGGPRPTQLFGSPAREAS